MNSLQRFQKKMAELCEGICETEADKSMASRLRRDADGYIHLTRPARTEEEKRYEQEFMDKHKVRFDD